nr:PREDICTED: uncharacterized protein LOC109628990 [Paralichthys olivaceus]
MNEEPQESPAPGREPVQDDVGQTTEEKPSSRAESPSRPAPSHEPIGPSDSLPPQETPSPIPIEKSPEEANEEEARAAGGEPPADWFEPLEDDEEDDANSYFGRNDAEEESLAGESERSESVAGSEKAFKKIYQIQTPRRKRSHPDEGWEEWLALGEGWKRKEVIRRSGSSIGQKDVYYMSSNIDCFSLQSEFADSQHQSLKSSDTENFSVNVDVEDEDDMSTDDDDDWHKKRKRRSCGECKACLCRKDCGTCDFCVDKPKFGGSNKKRQKCRLRQCQRQAMRHLLPFQMGQGDFGPDGPMTPGRPRPHYTYSRKSNLKKNKGQNFGLDFTDNEDDDFQPISWSTEPARGSKHSELNPLNYSNPEQRNGLSERVPHVSHHNYSQLDQQRRSGRDGVKPFEDDDEDDEDEEEELPMITQIYSLADNAAGSGTDIENQLMKLLHSLRTSVLPILWYAIMVEGPQLQVIQCSKQSNMTDTMVLIDPGFFYQVTVQKQPLLPTHPLYDNYPARLTSVTEVVNLLLGLEKYAVCQGLSPKESSPKKDPIVLERASTCDFLVKRNVNICSHCRALQGL